MKSLLARLQIARGASSDPVASPGAWWDRYVAVRATTARTMDAALLAGAAMDRAGWAFASGYEAALEALFAPALDRARPASLLATERDGGHPRAIRTTLSRGDDGGLRLRGSKRFATLAPCADTLLVVASEGDDPVTGRNRLCVVQVARSAPGVTLTALPAMPFVPEVPHAEVTFEDTPVAPGARLEGDGYARWLKPFRTVEDCHVHGALLGWLTASAHALGFARPACERLLALSATARALGDAGEPDAPAVHLALAGLLALSRAEIDALEPEWSRPTVPAVARERWQRDRALLDVAARVRAARTARAWQRDGDAPE